MMTTAQFLREPLDRGDIQIIPETREENKKIYVNNKDTYFFSRSSESPPTATFLVSKITAMAAIRKLLNC